MGRRAGGFTASDRHEGHRSFFIFCFFLFVRNILCFAFLYTVLASKIPFVFSCGKTSGSASGAFIRDLFFWVRFKGAVASLVYVYHYLTLLHS